MKIKENIFRKALGRPLMYPTVEDMNRVIDEYFNEAKEGEYTICGLSLALGMDRKTLIEYADRGEFSNTVKRAKLLIEQDYEKSLRLNGRAGEIFGLKNFGWTDKYDIENTGHITHDHQAISEDVGLLRGWREPGREAETPPDTLPN